MKKKTNLIVSLLTLLTFALSAVTPGFAAASSPLWEDLSPHKDFPVEWWYMTGFLKTEKGQSLGFQATFFRMENRNATSPPSPSPRGPWAPREIFGFHGAVSDLDRKTFVSTERERREFSKSVGTKSTPFSVHIGRNRLDHTSSSAPSLSLAFRVENQSFSLTLTPESPPVWHDKDKKFFTGPNPTDWAYYYSYPLVRISGTRTLARPDGTVTTEKVHGQCWFDHEWMFHTMNKNQIGWIWLWGWNKANTRGIMLYQMINRGGELSRFHRATIIEKDGENWKITRSRNVLLVGGKTGRCLNLDRIAFEIGRSQMVQVHPEIERQRLGGTVSYWEGASKVNLGRTGAPDQGRGYLEVTGLDRWENGKLCRSSQRK